VRIASLDTIRGPTTVLHAFSHRPDAATRTCLTGSILIILYRRRDDLKLAGPRCHSRSVGHPSANELDDLLGVWLPSSFEFGVDQVTVHGDLVHTSVISDHVNGFDPIAKLLLQCFRYTSSNGAIASRGAIANTYLHLFLLYVTVMRQILSHIGAVGKQQPEGVGKKRLRKSIPRRRYADFHVVLSHH